MFIALTKKFGINTWNRDKQENIFSTFFYTNSIVSLNTLVLVTCLSC